MENAFVLGNQIITLDETPSTNTYLQELIVKTECFEGLVIVAKKQVNGKGQRGNTWESEDGKNLTFSLLLKPNLPIEEQFLLSQTAALGIYDFLKAKNIEHVAIKWPNDIYVGSQKIAGILIENTLTANKISNCIVGIGLNVNQTQFLPTIRATSLALLTKQTSEIEQLLIELLKCIEVRYFQLKANKYTLIKLEYLKVLFGYQKLLHYVVNNQRVTGIIKGISPIGKLQVEINSHLKEFDLKEITLVV